MGLQHASWDSATLWDRDHTQSWSSYSSPSSLADAGISLSQDHTEMLSPTPAAGPVFEERDGFKNSGSKAGTGEVEAEAASVATASSACSFVSTATTLATTAPLNTACAIAITTATSVVPGAGGFLSKAQTHDTIDRDDLYQSRAAGREGSSIASVIARPSASTTGSSSCSTAGAIVVDQALVKIQALEMAGKATPKSKSALQCPSPSQWQGQSYNQSYSHSYSQNQSKKTKTKAPPPLLVLEEAPVAPTPTVPTRPATRRAWPPSPSPSPSSLSPLFSSFSAALGSAAPSTALRRSRSRSRSNKSRPRHNLSPLSYSCASPTTTSTITTSSTATTAPRTPPLPSPFFSTFTSSAASFSSKTAKRRRRILSDNRRRSLIPQVPPLPAASVYTASLSSSSSASTLVAQPQLLSPAFSAASSPFLSADPYVGAHSFHDDDEFTLTEHAVVCDLDSDLVLARALAPVRDQPSYSPAWSSSSGPTCRSSDPFSPATLTPFRDSPTLPSDLHTPLTDIEFDLSPKPSTPHGPCSRFSAATFKTSTSCYYFDDDNDAASILSSSAGSNADIAVVFNTATVVRAACARPEVVDVRRPSTLRSDTASSLSSRVVLLSSSRSEPSLFERRAASAPAAAAAAAAATANGDPSTSPPAFTSALSLQLSALSTASTLAPPLEGAASPLSTSPRAFSFSMSSRPHSRGPSAAAASLAHQRSYSAMKHHVSQSSLQNNYNHGHTPSSSTIATYMSDGSSPGSGSLRRGAPPAQLSVEDFAMLPPTIQRKYFSEGERQQFVKARASEESFHPNSTSRPVSPLNNNFSHSPPSRQPNLQVRIPVPPRSSSQASKRPQTPEKQESTASDDLQSPSIFPTPGRKLNSTHQKTPSCNISDLVRRRSRANSLDSSFYASLPDKIQRRHLDLEEQNIAARHRSKPVRPPTLSSTDRLVLDWTRCRPSSNPTPPQSIYGDDGFVSSPHHNNSHSHSHTPRRRRIRRRSSFGDRLEEDGDLDLEDPFHKRVTVLLSPTIAGDSPVSSPAVPPFTPFSPTTISSAMHEFQRPPLRQTPSSPAVVSGHRSTLSMPMTSLETLGAKKKKDSFMDSLQWMDEEDDLDLKLSPNLHLDDYHQNLREQIPTNTNKPRPSFRRHLSINKIPFSRPPQINTRINPKDLQIQVGPYGPVSPTKRRSRAISLITPRSSPTLGETPMSPISPIDETAHYSDPNARLKLRLYLASPQKFDEAIQFGFPATAADPKSPALQISLHQSFQDSMSMVSPKTRSPLDDKLCTFLEDDRSSVYSADEDDLHSSPGSDAPPTPQTPPEKATARSSATAVASTKFSAAPIAKSSSSAIAAAAKAAPVVVMHSQKHGPKTSLDFDSLAAREMTLRMTLTRPDLRADDDQMYGWQPAPGGSSVTSQPASRTGSPTRGIAIMPAARSSSHRKVLSTASTSYETARSASPSLLVRGEARAYSPAHGASASVSASPPAGMSLAAAAAAAARDSFAKETIERQFAAFDLDIEQDRGVMKRIWHKVRRN